MEENNTITNTPKEDIFTTLKNIMEQLPAIKKEVIKMRIDIKNTIDTAEEMTPEIEYIDKKLDNIEYDTGHIEDMIKTLERFQIESLNLVSTAVSEETNEPVITARFLHFPKGTPVSIIQNWMKDTFKTKAQKEESYNE